MSKISEITFKDAVKIARRIKRKGGVGAKGIELSNRGDSLNRANLQSEGILRTLRQNK